MREIVCQRAKARIDVMLQHLVDASIHLDERDLDQVFEDIGGIDWELDVFRHLVHVAHGFGPQKEKDDDR